MSEIITARDPDIIAAEINTIKRQVQEAVIYATIKIGGKLTEAKGMVPKGEWGRWLEQNVEYSQSTAENMMRLYEEYGGNQESLFDTWTKSQAFGKLNYTQHLALLALPFADRQEFAEKNDAASMSTRQLQKAVEEEKHRRELAEKDLELSQAQLRDSEQNNLDLQQRLAAAQNADNSWKDQLDKLKQDKARAEKSESNALAVVKRLEKQLKEAQAQAETAQEDLKKAKEHPEIPGNLLEELRAQMETEMAEKARSDLEKQLKEANNALAAANARVQLAEEKLVAVQKEQKMNDQDLMAVQALGQQMLAMANSINGHRMKAVLKNESNAPVLEKFLSSLVGELRTTFGLK